VADDVVVNHLKIIAASKPDTDLDRRLDGTPLCVPHALRGLEIPRIDKRRLIEVFARESAALRSELRTLIEHADYRRIREPVGEERDAWVRAVHLMIGSPVYGGGRPS
jgi:hypothetical protein